MTDNKPYTQFQNDMEPANQHSQYPPQYPSGDHQMAAQYPGAGQQMAPQVMVQQVPPSSAFVVDTTHTVQVRWAWCNLVTALISVCFCPLFGVIATVSAILAYVDHKVKEFDRARGKRNVAWGFGIAGIVLGSISIILTIVLVAKAVQVAQAATTYNGYPNNG